MSMRALAGGSIQQKLLRMVLATSLAALLVAIVAMVGYDLRLYHQSWIADLATQAELIGRYSAPALAFDDARAARENLELLRYQPKVRAAAIYDPKGRLFAQFLAEGAEGFPKFPEADGTRVEGGDVVAFKRIVNDREILGTVYLRAKYEIYDRLFGYLGIAALVAAAALLVAYFLSRRLQRVITQPLLSIASVAREITEKRNYALRAEKLSSDEVGALADSLNAMLSEIERATRELEASSRETAHELTERRRAEEEILRLNVELEERVRVRTAQLEYTNGELEAFCYSVSHDLRAPLRAIDGFSQALVEDFSQQLPEEAKRYLARVRSSTQRMAQLIEDLLNLSRVSRGELLRQEVDVGDLARKVVADLQLRDAERKVEVTVWDEMRANADGRLLRAALENLIGNAWKFTAKAEHARIEVGALRDAGLSTFFVRDNGAGFDMAYADKLFGAFQRLHSVNEFQGTGIGLATVQRIVHRHGGRIWADAKPGKGAVFFFTLEAGAAQAAGAHAIKEHAS
jgi:signal transduction histidine kinase